MRAFASWVLARRYRLIVLAVAFAPLLPLVTAALEALETAHRGTVQGISSALIALTGILTLALLLGQNVALVAGIGGVSLAAGIGIGALLRETDSLALTFQSTLLVCAVAVALVTAVGPTSESLFGPLVDEFAALWRERGATAEQLASLGLWKQMLLGVVVGLAFVQLVAAGFLSQWWSSLITPVRSFGNQFRALRLGRILGIPATLVMVLGLVLDIPLIQNLSPLALFAFGFQGLAVLHAWAYARHWRSGVIVPVYVLLMTPLVGVILLALSAVGLVDSWFNLRAPLAAR
jgi:hypothetical protein